MRTKEIVAAVLWLTLAPGLCSAGPSEQPFSFLSLDADARAVGLAGAYTALATDSNSVLYNPAGLGKATLNEAGFMHSIHFAGVSEEYMGLATTSGWGADLIYLNQGGIQKTTLSNPDGTALGTVGASDLALGVGYGREIGGGLSLGASGKFIRETLADVSASAYAVDLGALYDVPSYKGLSFGLAIQNVGPPVRFQSARENLPLNTRLGVAYRFSAGKMPNTLSLDLIKERNDATQAAVGWEAVAAGALPLRLGFATSNDAGIGVTAGGGFVFKSWRADYAFVSYGDLGSSHRMSVAWLWGAAKGDAKKPGEYVEFLSMTGGR